MRIIGIFYVFAITVFSCSSVKKIAVEQDIARVFDQSEIFSGQFTGFSLFDIEKQRFVAGYNDTKRFTPASNTKILTMYATLKSFDKKLPALLVNKQGHTLNVRPVGNPTFLMKWINDPSFYRTLAAHKTIKINWPEATIQSFGKGWAWDDYLYNYQAERSWWPIYGNQVIIKKVNDRITVTPPFFEDYVEIIKTNRPGDLIDRELKYNLFKIYVENDISDFERTIPFDYSRELLLRLLSDTLNTTIKWSSDALIAPDTLFAGNTDQVLSLMMKKSDNFIAEQLLIMSAWKHGFSNVEAFIHYTKTHWFEAFNDFVWVDGSGLSRYNLIAPVDQVRLLKKAYDDFGWDRLQRILAVGGQSGTIKNWYAAEGLLEPFIYAKTGTLSNNHNLSGFIRVRSGKLMIFSFMNNHYTRPVNEVKKAMQKLLFEIRETY